MRRYGFERYIKEKKYHGEDRYFIFDRIAGVSTKLATVYDVADAEMIASALNYYAETAAERLNPPVKPVRDIAA